MKPLSPILRPLLILLLLIAICVFLYYGKSFLLPLTFGIVFAFLVNPIHIKLRKLGANKYIAAILSTTSILVFVVTLLSLVGWQIEQLSEQSDQIKQELVSLQKRAQSFTKYQFGVTFNKQEEYAEKAIDNLKSNVGKFIGTTASILFNFLLSLIYTILLLTEKKRIQAFFYRITESEKKMQNTIDETSIVIQKYLSGKLLIIGILAVAYATGFMIAGLNYAILIAVLAAFLSFIPYVGNLIGGSFAILITLATGGSITEIFILVGVMSLAQVIESYILEPWIVGSNVDLNPLFSILAVIAFGMIWGAGGALIALPIVGVLKVLFSNWKAYQAIGFLMGNDEVNLDESIN